MDKILDFTKKLIPKRIFGFFQPTYHWLLATLAAIIYCFPSRKLKVVGVTGTKGKSSVCELVSAILEEAGYKTAMASTIRFKIGERTRRNLFKMTMPGRFFIQKFLRRAVNANCDFAIIEMTSEGARQFRHKFIDLDALIFTNLAPEHLESHGGYEKYLSAKLSLAKALENSPKRPRTIVANMDDKEGAKFLAVKVEKQIPFWLDDAKIYHLQNDGVKMMFEGETIRSPLRGVFNIYNILAAAAFGKSQDIKPAVIKKAVEKISEIKGRAQIIQAGAFEVVVDYAHTPDSLRALYEAFPNKRKICVLGNTGGGRDKWKRPEMGQIADEYCDQIILTDEDSYDEDPKQILTEMATGIRKKKPEIILDRREAISRALWKARGGDAILITGKGTDPYIMGPNGSKISWSDERVVIEEIKKLKITQQTLGK